MKVLHSDEWVTIYLSFCPACDLPLELAESCRADDPRSWHRDGRPCEECPRCGESLLTGKVAA